jgi:hydrogenase expression/formation protein HypC
MCLGIPGQVLSVGAGTLPSGRVAFGGIQKEVCLAYVPEVKVGDYVIVHVGFAISIVNQDEARRTLAHLAELGNLKELEP